MKLWKSLALTAMVMQIPLGAIAEADPLPSPTEPVEQYRAQPILPLPGGLDDVLTFNSNSPELVLSPGILLSAFPPDGMASLAAHLNVPLENRFDLFAHHISKATLPEDDPERLRTLYLGIIVKNPGSEPVQVNILQGASYLSQPDAPFINLPAIAPNPDSTVYSGPGSRAMDRVLRGERQDSLPPSVEIPPGEFRMLLNLPIPIAPLDPPINGRSTFLRLRSTAPVYVASLAEFANVDANGNEQAPTLDQWRNLLMTGKLSAPRDRAPTPPDKPGGIIYGRVGGIARGSQWRGTITDEPGSDRLTIPAPGDYISYGLSLLRGGRMGTGQNQTAEMIARYPDTAYEAHGNYAIQYALKLPLHNPSNFPRTVQIRLETPIKFDEFVGSVISGLRFFDPLPNRTFFRGTVRVRYTDRNGHPKTRYTHLVQKRGQADGRLATFTMPPNSQQLASVDFLYPPDASPPQVLTLFTEE
ncbi:MAG: DUF3370 domain-containing protein [Cyanobacteria bacterium P01_C01_bin.89]